MALCQETRGEVQLVYIQVSKDTFIELERAFWSYSPPPESCDQAGVPLVLRHQPGKIWIAFVQKILIFDIAEPRPGAGELRIVVIDDGGRPLQAARASFTTFENSRLAISTLASP